MCCIWFCNMHKFRYVLMPFSNWTLRYFQVMLCWGFISLYLKYWECSTLIWKGSYYLTYFLQKAYLHCIWLGYHIQGKWLIFHVSIKVFFHFGNMNLPCICLLVSWLMGIFCSFLLWNLRISSMVAKTRKMNENLISSFISLLI